MTQTKQPCLLLPPPIPHNRSLSVHFLHLCSAAAPHLQPETVAVTVYVFVGDVCLLLGETEFVYFDPDKEVIKKLVLQPSELGLFLSKYAKERDKHECQNSSFATQEKGRQVLIIAIAIYTLL